MKITRIEVEKRCRSPREFPGGTFPEIAFAGRSNVGKSSLINSLLNRKRLVAVSSQPGKTRSVDFFLVNHRVRLVDLPGYGYARVPGEVRSGWKVLIEHYLKSKRNLVRVVWILDLRRDVGELDRMLEAWLRAYGIPYTPVCTKADKVPARLHPARLREIRAQLDSDEEPVLFSSKSGLGKADLWKRLQAAVSSARGGQEDAEPAP